LLTAFLERSTSGGFSTCLAGDSLGELKKQQSADGGTRLVNAKAVDGRNEFPFVSAYFIFGKAEMSKGCKTFVQYFEEGIAHAEKFGEKYAVPKIHPT
jgi:hypothetical protein